VRHVRDECMGKRHGERTAPVSEGLKNGLFRWFGHCVGCEMFVVRRETGIRRKCIRLLGTRGAKLRLVSSMTFGPEWSASRPRFWKLASTRLRTPRDKLPITTHNTTTILALSTSHTHTKESKPHSNTPTLLVHRPSISPTARSWAP
jgi:hypothetical protein